jgi:Ino eighty subunit 1
MSDVEPPSSPVHVEKSFMTAVTEDDDTRMMATPEPSERQSRGKKRGRDDGGANGNPIGKIRHLKKDDGEPLWRKDIQFDFLKAVFDNDAKVFTNSYEKDRIGNQCFADLYIDTMSRSSKTSKVLRDKLLSDREAAKGMAMVCLLVNVGRMNTTLNCTSSVVVPFLFCLAMRC